jgi:8-amino-7-oxononanoate synthase
MIPLMNDLQRGLESRRQKGNLRELKCSSSEKIDFASNDYLGLLHEGILHSFVEEEMEKLGEGKKKMYGATGSRLLTGNNLEYEELEKEIAFFHQAASGLIFNSGYLANLSILTAILRREDSVVFDSGVHASIHDALKYSQAEKLPFKHHDLDQFSMCLQRAKGRIFVCVESVYSCDGTQCDLKAIHYGSQKAGAHLIVDEAHATGCMGKNGMGLVQMDGLQDQVFARVHTFGKALGGQGAIVLGSSSLRDYLINFSRPLIYTTALPPYSLLVIRSAYRALQAFPHLRHQLDRRIHFFGEMIKGTALPIAHTPSPIQCLKIPNNEAVKRASVYLRNQGFDVRPLLSPTVRRGEECLRICVHAYNTEEEIERLIKLLGGICGA